MDRWIERVARLMLGGLLLLPLLLYSRAQWQRPPRTPLEISLYQGITYQRQVHDTPHAQIIHIVTIDLTAPGLAVGVTPGGHGPEGRWAIARTTSEVLQQGNFQLAVNASFFMPFREKTPWQFSPRPGELANVIGSAIADGEVYSSSRRQWPALCFDADNLAQIAADGHCPPQTQQAVAGRPLLVQAGTSLAPFNQDHPYARVAAAINAAGDRLWLIVADGKQPHYSMGLSLAQLAQFAIALGADAAINLDGGGSTTLVTATAAGPMRLNAPIHTKLPLRERPVANHLVFRARPLSVGTLD